MQDINVCKLCERPSEVKYKITSGNILACESCGFQHLDYLDEVSTAVSEIDENQLTNELREYIETQLQSSEQRFNNHVSHLTNLVDLKGKHVIDVGCGGGLFLNKVRALGANVMGIELDDGRASYCMQEHQLHVVKHPVESTWWERYQGHFDAVTLWDVIEHVNDPLGTLNACAKLLKPEGYLLLDTPARDAFYYRFGALTYAISFGYYPTFLNSMYSRQPFAHKQIFSTRDMTRLLESCGFSVTTIRKMHELSFPYEFYLKRILRSNMAAKLTAPMAGLFFKLFRIENKMLAVARKAAQ